MTHAAWRAQALAEADRVVGLYGDPSVTWAIALDARLSTAVLFERVASSLACLHTTHRHLGPPPGLRHVADEEMDGVRDALLTTPFTAGADLVQPVLSASGRRLLLVCHHGVIDGLGMLALLGPLIGTDLTSGARGVQSTPARSGFLRHAVGRFAEAVISPPQRFVPVSDGQAAGDRVLYREVPPSDTAALMAASRRALEEWNGSAPARVRRRPVVVAVGASRRASGRAVRPDRDTAYLRIRPVPAGTTLTTAREILRSTPPEPTFPTTRGLGVGPLVTRALAGRLGSSVLLSNLGRVRATSSGVLDGLAFIPATGGPSAVAVGLVTAAGTTTLAMRMRRSEFSTEAAEHLADLLARSL